MKPNDVERIEEVELGEENFPIDDIPVWALMPTIAPLYSIKHLLFTQSLGEIENDTDGNE